MLCVLALALAQTLGVQRGYVCLCAGIPMETQTSHCHGPHSEACHTEDAAGSDFHSEEDGADREDHAVVKDDLTARAAEAAPQVIAPQQPQTVLLVFDIFPVPQEAKLPVINFGEGSPPLGVAVADTVVFLI